ncbi:MAG TPA: choice-of-anchor Q domain-containing protein, partial [Flavisolibacter sp.]|nr:choice-of-anchor Q domain-containing protein [Flavisolibacter sp.]
LNGSRQYTVQVLNGPSRLYVHQTATGANNGSNWTHAFTDLQTALGQALGGDEIWVAKGSYSPGTTTTSYFTLKEGVKMYGGFAATEENLSERDTSKIRTVNETILDGSKGTASYHVVYNNAALTNATVLDGFSISGGRTAYTNSSSSLNANYYGAGIYNGGGSPVFHHLWIKNNIATYGGGMYNTGSLLLKNIVFSNNQGISHYGRGAALYTSGNVQLEDVLFEGNKINESSSYTVYGGALFVAGGSTELRRTIFKNNNIAYGNGGAIYSTSNASLKISDSEFSGNQATIGGAIFVNNGIPVLDRVLFKDNRSVGSGGALYLGASSSPVLNWVSFIGNSSGQHGGAIWTSGLLKMDNSMFSRNKVNSTAAYYGGAIYAGGGTTILNNISFSNNAIAYVNASATLSYGGAIYRASGTVNVGNSIFWGNIRGNQVSDQLNANVTVGSSIVQGGYASGTDILFGDPMFMNPLGDDLHLQNGSLAVDAGDNRNQSYDKDLAGQPRIVNELIDLGAYENEGGAKLQIRPVTLPSFRRGTNPEFQLSTIGESGPVSWNLQSGKLPVGVLLTPEGILRGTPTVLGTYTFVIGASDGNLASSRQYTVEVLTGPSRLYVHQNATGVNNGSNWTHAFTDLQTALSQASAGDEIWVAKGNYSPGTTVTSYFTLKEGVKMYGGFVATEQNLSDRDTSKIRTVNETILDGKNTSRHVVYNAAALTVGTVVDGFSIIGGRTAYTYSSSSLNANYYGGGIYNGGGSPVFNHLWIKNNTGTYGGGMYNSGNAELKNVIFSNNQGISHYGRGAALYTTLGNIRLEDVLFEGNKINESSSYTVYGGAVFAAGGSTDLNRTIFKNNYIAYGQGGAIYSTSSAFLKITDSEFISNQATTGGAMFVNNGIPTLDHVLFKDNKSIGLGGALYLAASSSPVLNRISFISNSSGQHGGAIWTSGLLKMDNSIFSRNKVNSIAAYYGGAIYVGGGTTNLSNISFNNNTMGYVNAGSTLKYGGAIYRASGTVNVVNSIFWGNNRGYQVDDQLNANIIVSNSIVQDGYASGTDIFLGDPMFVNPLVDNLHLQNGSLAVDAGDNKKQNYDKDLAGQPRIVNELIDLGAYENEGGAKLQIWPATLPAFSRGTAPEVQLSTSGSSGAVSWSLQAGKLPVGMMLTPEGVLSGNPTVLGTYTFVIGASDGILSGNRQYTIEVLTGPSRLYVYQNATGGNNGSNWTHAFTDLQKALSQASDGDEIWVAKGTYSPGTTVTSYFTLKEGVKMYGGFAATEQNLSDRDTSKIRTVNETILDGKNISRHVVYNAAALTVGTVLDGFSIVGGRTAYTYSSSSLNANYYGGGIYNGGGSPVFRHLWIKNNTATFGGGIYNSGNADLKNIIFSNNQGISHYGRGAALYTTLGNIRLEDILFEGNKINESSSYTVYGGAVFVAGGSIDLNRTIFKNNYIAYGQGGAIYSTSSASLKITNSEFISNQATTGGAMFVNNGIPTLDQVLFKDNKSIGLGGALYLAGGSSPVLNRISFIGNNSGQHGGAIWTSGLLKMDNSIFSRNKVSSIAAYYGGAIYVGGGTTNLSNISFSNNTIGYVNTSATLSYGGALYRTSGTVNVGNSIFWGNSRGNQVPDQLNLNASVNVSNSIVYKGYANGVNIIDRDPEFVNPMQDDLRLSGCSPAINTGDNSKALNSSPDLAGNPRIITGVVDMGALEYQQAAIGLLPETLPEGNRGFYYSEQLNPTGGSGTYTYKIISGKLPDGLYMDSSGLISGNPIANGSYTFAVSVTDGILCGNRIYTVNIIPGTGVVRMYVNQAATSGQNNGSNWNNAYLDLQRALAVSMSGDEIWVAKGNYNPGDLVTSSFILKEGVKLYGGFAATEQNLSERDSSKIRTVNETILNGRNINRHVVYNKVALTAATVLDGFTISGGRTATGSSGEAYYGAGIYNSAGAAVFRNLWVKNNNAYYYGGGMLNGGPASFTNIIFENNTVSGGAAYGGGLYNSGAATFDQVTFLDNKAAIGGGMFNTSAPISFNKVLFKDNAVSRLGGGFYNTGATVTFNLVSFIANTSAQHGAGIYQNSGTLNLTNAIFSRNKVSSSYYGGGMYHNSGTSNLYNVTFSNNSINYVNAVPTNKYGGALYRYTGTVNVYNSIFWGNKRANAVDDQLNLNINLTNALVQGGYDKGTVIVNADPLFINAAADNLTLQSCSPAINMGDNLYASGITTDLVGQPRITSGAVDLGAYENQEARILPAPATLPDGVRGQVYNQQLTANGGNGNYTFKVSYGKLPDGLVLSSTGKITGRPLVNGSYTFNVTVGDGELCGNRLYTMDIMRGNGTVRIYVNQAAVTGMNNGADWTNAYLDLQKGLSSAQEGDSIWVAKGDYIPGTAVTSYFTLKEGVKLLGGFAGTEDAFSERDNDKIRTVNETILNGKNISRHVVYNKAALTGATILDGFSIVGGRTATGSTGEAYYGAGIYNSAGSAIFRNLWIKNNNSYNYGGGVFNTATAAFEDIIFENNTVVSGGNAWGGGIYNSGASSFNKVKFINNKAALGGGMFNNLAAITLTDGVFKDNSATGQAGAFYNYNNGKPVLTNVSFIANTAGQHGGAIYQASGTIDLNNVVFSRNQVSAIAAYYGGALYHYSGTSNLVNVTFNNNSIRYANNALTNQYGGAIYRYTGAVNVVNSIIWSNKRGNNVPDQLVTGITVSNSIVENGYKTGTMILTVDPQFNNAAADDLSLSSCSPAINLGDNSKVASLSTDLNGNARIMHGIVDLGAYEYQGQYLNNAEEVLPDADQWTPYKYQIKAVEGNYTYSLIAGALPDGMILSSDGTLSGEPTMPGDFEFNVAVNGADICGNVKLKLKVKAQEPYIIEVLNPYPLPVNVSTGTPFSDLKLVTQIEVILSNNTKTKVLVTWQEGDYNKDVEGLYTLKGLLTVAKPEINRNNLFATVKVAVMDPIYPYIIEVAHLDSVYVLSGTSFVDLVKLLPSKVEVTYNEESQRPKEKLSLIWKEGKYDGKPGAYRLSAELVMPAEPDSEHFNPEGFEAYIDVYAQRKIVKVEPQVDLYVDLNTPKDLLTLTQKVRVTYHDESTGLLSVNWNRDNYISNKGGEYILTGDFILTDWISNADNHKAEIKVIIRKNIVSVKPLAPAATKFGTTFDKVKLPDLAEVVFDDGTTDNVGVKWIEGDYNAMEAGTYTIFGELLHSDDIDNYDQVKAKIDLTVLLKPRNIIEIAPIDTVYVTYGKALADIPELAAEIHVKFDDQTSGTVPVIWETFNYNPLVPGVYTFVGEPVLSDVVDNTEYLTAEISVVVKNKHIIAVTDPQPVKVKYGTQLAQLELPEKVSVTYNDHSTGEESVDWVPSNYNPEQPGTY